MAGARLVQVDPEHPEREKQELARSGRDGRFSFERPQGSPSGAQIQVRYWNLLPTSFIIPVATESGVVEEPVVRLLDGYAFGGRLSTTQGQPLPGALLSLYRENGETESRSTWEIVTDPNGYFCFSHLPRARFRGDVVAFRHGPKQHFSIDLTGEELDRALTFVEAPRPEPKRFLELNGIVWAEMTRDIARYYGYPEHTERLVAMPTDPTKDWMEGKLLKGIEVGNKVVPAEERSLRGMDDLLERLADLIPGEGEARRWLHLSFHASPVETDPPTGTQGIVIEAKALDSLRALIRNRPKGHPVNF